MYIDFHRVFIAHHLDEIATGLIAHFSTPLDSVASRSNMEVASSSRLANDAEKSTLKPVQLRFLG